MILNLDETNEEMLFWSKVTLKKHMQYYHLSLTSLRTTFFPPTYFFSYNQRVLHMSHLNQTFFLLSFYYFSYD